MIITELSKILEKEIKFTKGIKIYIISSDR